LSAAIILWNNGLAESSVFEQNDPEKFAALEKCTLGLGGGCERGNFCLVNKERREKYGQLHRIKMLCTKTDGSALEPSSAGFCSVVQ
jgi:hypothetical protein